MVFFVFLGRIQEGHLLGEMRRIRFKGKSLLKFSNLRKFLKVIKSLFLEEVIIPQNLVIGILERLCLL